MDQLLSDNWAYAKSRGWDKYVGNKKFSYTFRGQTKTTTLTKEGLLASMHLGGPKSTGKFLRGIGNAADNLGTTVGAYAGHHGTNCGGTSEAAEDGLGQESDAKLAESMNWDDCFEWEQPSVQVVGMCGDSNPAPIIAVDFKYTEPPLLIEANTESGKSAIMDVPGVSEAMAALANGDRSSPNFSANMPGAGHIPRAFFEAHVWGVSPKGRFDSSGEEMDVKRSLACDLADEMSTWENAWKPEVKLQTLQQQQVQQILANWAHKWFQGTGVGTMQATANNQTVRDFSGFSGNELSGLGDIATGAQGALGQMTSHIGDRLNQSVGMLSAAANGEFSPMQLAQMAMGGAQMLQQFTGGGQQQGGPTAGASISRIGGQNIGGVSNPSSQQPTPPTQRGAPEFDVHFANTNYSVNDETNVVAIAKGSSTTNACKVTAFVDGEFSGTRSYHLGQNEHEGVALKFTVEDGSSFMVQDEGACSDMRIVSVAAEDERTADNPSSSPGDIGGGNQAEQDSMQNLMKMAQTLTMLSSVGQFADMLGIDMSGFGANGLFGGLSEFLGGNSGMLGGTMPGGTMPGTSGVTPAPSTGAATQPVVVPVFLSEAVPSVWRRDTSTVGRTELGVWGPTYPLNGIVPTSGANNIRGAGLASYRGYRQAEPRISKNKKDPEHMPDMNLDYPHKTKCFKPGTSDSTWESRSGKTGLEAGKVMGSGEPDLSGGIEDGKNLFTYWKESACTMRVCTKNWKILSNKWTSGGEEQPSQDEKGDEEANAGENGVQEASAKQGGDSFETPEGERDLGPDFDREIRNNIRDNGGLPADAVPTEEVTLRGPNGEEVKVKVGRDYLNSNGEYVPLSKEGARGVAADNGVEVVTPGVHQAIESHPSARQVPFQPQSPNSNMTRWSYTQQHNSRIGDVGDGLVYGHKKAVVNAGESPSRIAIMGGKYSNGGTVQPLSTVHGSGYADYSHGVRFMSSTATVNGRSVPISQLLQDPGYRRVFGVD